MLSFLKKHYYEEDDWKIYLTQHLGLNMSYKNKTC